MVVVLLSDFVAKCLRSGMVGGRVRTQKFYQQLPKDYHKNRKLTDFGFGVVKARVKVESSIVPDGYEESDYEKKVRRGY